MKIIYLASYKAKLNTNHQIIYQDKYIQRDLSGDMLDIDLTPYDLIIATPPCNYYSRANWRRNISNYSINTKHLLPMIINKLQRQNKPYIVENVQNNNLMKDIIKTFNGFIYYHSRHIYFTNVILYLNDILEIKDNIQNTAPKDRQGGLNVQKVLERFILTNENKN